MKYFELDEDVKEIARSANFIVFKTVDAAATWPVQTLVFHISSRTFETFNALPGKGGDKLGLAVTKVAAKRLTPEQLALCTAAAL